MEKPTVRITITFDIAAIAVLMLLVTVFGNIKLSAAFLILMGVFFLLKHATKHNCCAKIVRIVEVIFISLVGIWVIGEFVIYPNTRGFRSLRNSLPIGKIEYKPEPESGSLKLIGIDTNFKETIFKSSPSAGWQLNSICSDDLENQIRIHMLKNPITIYEPWTGIKIICSTVWYNISYIRNGSLYLRNNEVVFDSIESNGTLSYGRLHGNTLYTYMYVK